MLTPRLCACGCLQPFIGDDEWRDGMLRNHGEARRVPNTPSYLVEDHGYKTPCWVWQGVLNKWGYAKTKRLGRTMAGHRVFYQAYIGPLPVGDLAGPHRMQLDHLCRVRRCVNPEHLEPATCVENNRRGMVVHIAQTRENQRGVLQEMADRYKAGESQYTIARAFGLGQTQISRILSGKRWKGVIEPVVARSPIKLTLEQVREIRSRKSSGEHQKSLAAAFGIAYSSVRRIVREESWREV